MPEKTLRLKYLVQHIKNDLKIGFLIRPLSIALVIGSAGMFISSIEELYPQISRCLPNMLFPTTKDPAVAQIILGNIASSMMTVVSIVFAILLMTLTLASTQFSPRIITGFVKDKITQQTLGIFIGTYLYCLGALPAAHTLPNSFCPVVAVFGAMMLAFICVTWLLYFIIHISRAVSVNHLVHRIARDTEDIIAKVMPEPLKEGMQQTVLPSAIMEGQGQIVNNISGYIRYIDAHRLFSLAKSYNITISSTRRIGHFVPEGIPIANISDKNEITPELEKAVRKAYHIGPTRSLDRDIEFGILQLVDIGLKAVSPAVNDPSTAITCIDQLSSILIKFASQKAPQTAFYYPEDKLRLTIPWLGFDRILESAFEQIRLYSQTDVAVSLRLLRAFSDIATTLPDQDSRKLLVEQGRRLVAGCSEKLADEVLKEMHSRLAALEKLG